MNRKILTSLIVIVLAIAAITGGTLAWFTDQTSTTSNTFTAGTVKIRADESANFTAEVTNWNPGDHSEENLDIKNTGTKRLFLRVKITEEWKDTTGVGTDKITFARDAANVDWYDNYDDDKTELIPWNNEGKWVNIGNYWYYNEILDPTDPTNSITFLGSVGLKGAETTNAYQGATYSIDLTFDAIQVTHGAEESWGVKFTPGEGNKGTWAAIPES
jgi:alternate signal-mediated exported protein